MAHQLSSADALTLTGGVFKVDLLAKLNIPPLLLQQHLSLHRRSPLSPPRSNRQLH